MWPIDGSCQPSFGFSVGRQLAVWRYFFLWHSRHFTGAGPPFCRWQSMHVPVAALGSWNAAWRLVFTAATPASCGSRDKPGAPRTAASAAGSDWWQVVQAMPRSPAWPSWSNVTAPSFPGSVILPVGLCSAGGSRDAGAATAGFSASAVGGGAAVVATGVGGAFGGVACVATGSPVTAGGEAGAGASVAPTPGVADAGRVVTGGSFSLFPQAKATVATRTTVASRRAARSSRAGLRSAVGRILVDGQRPQHAREGWRHRSWPLPGTMHRA